MTVHSPSFKKAIKEIDQIKGKTLSPEERAEAAVRLAGLMLQDAAYIQTKKEKKLQEKLSRLMKDPIGKAFTTMMTDQCFRSDRPQRIANELCYLLNKVGIPKYFYPSDRLKLRAFKRFGEILPSVFVPLTKYMLRRETSSVILPGENASLKKHIEARTKQGVRINLNRLGEAILGEKEALRRLDIYLKDLEKPEIEYISVKISTIFSQINLLAWEASLDILSERLKKLYRSAISHVYIHPDGKTTPKFVNLDMEEYRDLQLTVSLFKRVLDEPEFFKFSAGIVLQSYLPDSHLIQRELTEWALKRVAKGGAPIKIRIVKGANLAMEQVEASLKSWPQAPYASKNEVDANFKRMVVYGCTPEHANAAHIGIGSHNLFDIAYAMVLKAEGNINRDVCFEMLEGMADHIRRVVQNLSGDMLLYCPAAKREEFQNAVAYLMRRLDENTGHENFLRHAFGLTPGTSEWEAQKQFFKKSCDAIENLYAGPRKMQNRFLDTQAPEQIDDSFQNEADTDWSLPINRKWGETIVNDWSNRKSEKIPIVINSREYFSEESCSTGSDPSNPDKPLYNYALATSGQAEDALDTAEHAQKSWAQISIEERCRILKSIAHHLRKSRHILLGAMLADGGKTLPEGDVEVSEAIDFAEYYCQKALELQNINGVKFKPKGTVLVAPPWNFPCSIPSGGILAALVTGNTVIFKPAPESVLVGWHLVNIFWEAGVPKDVLQFLCCADEPVGSQLVKDRRISCVILTGATATAKYLLKLRPGLDLIAETGGKNAIIVTDMSDRDLAIKDILQSAFSHSGQKCSAASLLICEGPVYDDLHFLEQLKDAAESLPVGSSWSLKTKIPPLIHPPTGALLKALTSLDEGEQWLLKPKQNPENPNLWSPGIKLGVKENSFMHQTELFGPVLGVMRADDLQHAIHLANSTSYGLTSGLHSLDEREHSQWKSKIKAGNCYINRSITGAIVQRQPFGGWKESSFGSGAKAGGPNYLFQLLQCSELSLPSEKADLSSQVLSLKNIFSDSILSSNDLELLDASLSSYAYWWNLFKKPQDPTLLIGQDNFFQLVPGTGIALRVHLGIKFVDIVRVCAAALTCGSSLEISCPEGHLSGNVDIELIRKASVLFPTLHFVEESEDHFWARVENKKFSRVRLISPPAPELEAAAAFAACHLVHGPIMADGRLELLHYTKELSTSFDYHRYGNLQAREGEKRRPLKNGKNQ